jgi:hypothetical protein
VVTVVGTKSSPDVHAWLKSLGCGDLRLIIDRAWQKSEQVGGVAPAVSNHLPSVMTLMVRVIVVPITLEQVRVNVLILELKSVSAKTRFPVNPETGLKEVRFAVSKQEVM